MLIPFSFCLFLGLLDQSETIYLCCIPTNVLENVNRYIYGVGDSMFINCICVHIYIFFITSVAARTSGLSVYSSSGSIRNCS